jgi:PAS domain S-box-containing protein
LFEIKPEDLLDRLTESISVYDFEARILYINPAGAVAFGRPASELVGQRPWDIVRSPKPTPFREALQRVLAGGAKESVVSYVKAFDRWYDSDVYPYPTGALVVARDITARRTADEQLAQARRLEALGRLAGGVAHDFNNLLSVILGSTELMQRRVPTGDPLHQDLAEVAGAAERAAIITRQLLAIGGRQRLAPLLVHLSDHVEAMEPMLRRLLTESVQVELDLDPALGTVRVDPGQMEQVLLNLVVNARDAMPRGGSIMIRTSKVDVPSGGRDDVGVPPGRYAKLTVSDTGVGMSDEVRARVFEPFFTTKEPGRGTGLGLATVRGIVEQSAGVVRMHTEPGRGTAFHLYLPREDEAPSTSGHPSPPSFEAAANGSETVLLVEDDAAVRQYVRRALRLGGYVVLDAENAGAALLILEQHVGPVHLLVADVVMSRMSGPQLAARLRSIRPELPALYMSGHPAAGIDDSGSLGPNEAFVSKPVRPKELLRAVRASIDRAPR